LNFFDDPFDVAFEIMFWKPGKGVVESVLNEDAVGFVMEYIPLHPGQAGVGRIAGYAAVDERAFVVGKPYAKHLLQIVEISL
jgi:hypothetical protein